MTFRTAFGIFLLATLSTGCSVKQENNAMNNKANELISESSPYLLQHAYNPVDWHAWNTENLKRAEKLEKPLLISIGYSSCHWCHVMEHESFEDEEVANYMNANFYCIKVDREERPDVDQVYMTAANIITGRGGWPLNCFALPDGRPFHAGTYYPKAQWLTLLKQVKKQYDTDREKITAYAQKLTQGIRLQETAISDSKANELDAEVPGLMVEQWKSYFDMKEGGMLRPPKFPMPSNYRFLLRYALAAEDKQVKEFIATSLEKMAYGGLFDQVGGGFARYSTDGLWKVPHFEKMLYDNGQLIQLYAEAYRIDPNPLYKTTVESTIDWCMREMKGEQGLYYSALDADSEGEEGKFYIWTTKELQEVLGSDFDATKRYYNVNAKGLWEHGNYILLRDQSDQSMANELGLSAEDWAAKRQSINDRLLAARSKRPRPGTDDKCLTSWNGLMISGLVAAYHSFNSNEYLKEAEYCADALWDEMWKKKELLHRFKDGDAGISGLLEDYVFAGKALLDLYSATGKEKYYKRSYTLCTQMLERFYDSNKGLFYFNEENELVVRSVEIYDNVIPSTNAVASQLLHLHGLIQGKPEYLRLAAELTGRIQTNMAQYPSGHSYWGLHHMQQSFPFYECVIIGDKADELAREFHRSGRLNILVCHSREEVEIPVFRGRYRSGKTMIYICEEGVCQQPVETVAEALQLMN